MLTLFTAPKPFRGLAAIHQKNALGSWIRIEPKPRIILFGRDEGVEEVARAVGACHYPDVETNEYGTPLVSDMFRLAETHGDDLLAFANADILFLEDFSSAVENAERAGVRFLMSGRRWNLDLPVPINFSSEWRNALRHAIHTHGVLHSSGAMDYFVFRKGTLGPLPPLAVGRAGWDNYLIFRARQQGMSVIDATDAIMAIHQNHAYEHIPEGDGKSWLGPETRRNREIIGSEFGHSLDVATHVLSKSKLRWKKDRRFWWSLAESIALVSPSLGRLSLRLVRWIL